MPVVLTCTLLARLINVAFQNRCPQTLLPARGASQVPGALGYGVVNAPTATLIKDESEVILRLLLPDSVAVRQAAADRSSKRLEEVQEAAALCAAGTSKRHSGKKNNNVQGGGDRGRSV